VDCGKGYVLQAGRRYELRGGEVFLIFPKTKYAFAAEKGNPWDVYWINFDAKGLDVVLRRMGVTPREFVRFPKDRDRLRELFCDLFRCLTLPEGLNASAASVALWGILGQFAFTSAARLKKDSPSITATRNYIDAHLMEPISIGRLAKLAHQSRFYFMRTFKKETGLSPVQYQISRRMSRAKELLAQGLSVKETADRVGYSDLFYFSRLFKLKTSLAPSKYAGQSVM
jgi:AraC family transcriptional regulator, arabinose operon regulatory protein